MSAVLPAIHDSALAKGRVLDVVHEYSQMSRISQLQSSNVTIITPEAGSIQDEGFTIGVGWNYTDSSLLKYESLSLLSANSTTSYVISGPAYWYPPYDGVGLMSLNIIPNTTVPEGQYRLVMDVGSQYISPRSAIFRLINSTIDDAASSSISSPPAPSTVFLIPSVSATSHVGQVIATGTTTSTTSAVTPSPSGASSSSVLNFALRAMLFTALVASITSNML
ncbi:hypothetical protein F5884DRAFT_854345 [Xylogone sp. PMI_703]|nr:hypothetical protein F5884DRAFT_854345 [Xylogone sp. PMI_703]